MKTLICLTLAAGALIGPEVSFADSAPSELTRAQVIAELVQLEKAGYTSGSNDVNYPEDIQAALAKIDTQHAHQEAIDSLGGAEESGSSQAGSSRHETGEHSIYFGQ